MARDRAARPEARPLRLFIAVDLPQDVRELVDRGVEPIRERYPQGRWVPVRNQHVTLKFLGATWPRLVEGVLATVGSVAARHRPFETRVSGLGAFPSVRRARVLWAGLEDPAGRLAAIAADLDAELARDFAPEKRPFAAHLTVARFDPPVPLAEDLAEIGLESRPFEVAWLVVYRSHLQRPAPVYEPLATFPLGDELRDP
ncbi:MAG: RNA 2',3'-cyclic phosphodiesterase [Actinomycetota bacterium]|nr:MAG: RNA 2',3'-cyclic phosphodiesterase [Actinomycetota bacterium]